MILIQWLKFLFLIQMYIVSFFVNKLHFPRIFLNIYDYVFPIYDLHSYSIFFKNNLIVLIVFPFIFFPSSYSCTFHPFSSFPICLFFLSLFSSFFSFPILHHFLNLVCHFLRAPLPCSRTFCCPEWMKE